MTISEEKLRSMNADAQLATDKQQMACSLFPALMLELVQETQRARAFSERVYGFLTQHHPDAQQWLDAALAAAQGAQFMPDHLPDTGTEIVDGDSQWLKVLKHPIAGAVLYRRGHENNTPSTVVEIFFKGKFGHAIQDFQNVNDRDQSFSVTSDQQVLGVVDVLLSTFDKPLMEN